MVRISRSNDPYIMDMVTGFDIAALTRKNSKFIKAVLKLDSNYKKEQQAVPPDDRFDLNAHASNSNGLYCGSAKFWFNEMTNNDSYYSYKECVLGAVIAIDRSNSTHLETTEDGRKKMATPILTSVIERSTNVMSFESIHEGDLIKLDAIKLELVDEELAKQILIIRRNALKGLCVEGMEISNFVDSILQDYAYILRGKTSDGSVFILKIPTDIKSEFESKYSVNDLMIGHVSVIGIFKGKVSEECIKLNMLNSFKLSSGDNDEPKENSRIINSNAYSESVKETQSNDTNVYYIDTLAVVQDLSFHIEAQSPKKLHWWNKFGLWLCALGRKE